GFSAGMQRGGGGVGLRVASSRDGRTALGSGERRWIAAGPARLDGHRFRARACAILTGIGTVRHDDPMLTVRDVATPRQPLRVIVDSRLETPREARVLQGERALIFAAREGALPNAEVVALPNASGKVDLP